MSYYFWILGIFSIVSFVYVANQDEGNFAGIETAIVTVILLIMWACSGIVYFITR